MLKFGIDIDGQAPGSCSKLIRPPLMVVLTGGPGAGKTAVLEASKKIFCRQVAILPESAGIVFGGGFPRLKSPTGRQAAQRAIYHVQNEIEELVNDEKRWSLVLCDRGTLDGLAYWQGSHDSYFRSFNTNFKKEYNRYDLVLHLRSPGRAMGYNYENPLRTETPEEAEKIDRKIKAIWKNHKNYIEIPSQESFFDKVSHSIDEIRKLPGVEKLIP